MRLIRGIWAWLRPFRTDTDLQNELQTHFEQEIEDNLARGLSEAEARRRARLKLGHPLVIIERTRDQEIATAVGNWFRDLATGFRTLRKSPAFFLTTSLTLALGIGANTAIFTLLYSLLLRGLPVNRPAELARIAFIDPTEPAESSSEGLSWPMIQYLRGRQQSFTDISAWSFGSLNMKDREGTLRMFDAGVVSGNAFTVLGVKPYLGRLIGPADDVRGGPPEGWPVVLSYGTWTEVFRGDPQVLGKHITLSDVPVTVIGVTSAEFQGIMPGTRQKLYVPLQFVNVLRGKDVVNEPTSGLTWAVIARLMPGVALAQANAEIAAYKNALFERYLPPEVLQDPLVKRARIQVSSARTGLPSMARGYRQPLFLLQGLVGIVLLLCCVNVGGLMMSKFYTRRSEFAIRTAIGAGRWRLMRQYLTESCIIAAVGALAGGAGAWFGTGAMLQYFVDPYAQEGLFVRPDAAIFGISAVFGVIATLVFGTLPAWWAGRCDPATLLVSRRVTGVRKQMAARAFVPVQIAISLVLVAIAGLLSESLIRIRGEHAGFDVDHITLTTPIFNRLPLKPAAKLDLYQAMVDRLERAPGVQAAAITYYTPVTNAKGTSAFRAAAGDVHPPEDPKMAFNVVGPGYFRTMQTRVISGREFDRRERDFSVCMINQSAAGFLFPHQEPIGQYVKGLDRQLFPNGLSCRVIGVAEDAKYANLREPAPRTIYLPMTPEWVAGNGNMVFLMRSAAEREATVAYRASLAENAPNTPLLRFVTLHRQLDDSMGAQRLLTLLSDVFAGLALFLSAIGLYGLLASGVAQRTVEIGVRVALGAQRRSVLWMILGEAARLYAAGIILGLFGLWVAVRFVEGMLFGVSAFNPSTLAATAVLLGIVAFVAAALPAHRAASVDPMDALRAE
ncbi:MAG: ADOP family duplicated permease [Bryobacteraceae bacterium]